MDPRPSTIKGTQAATFRRVQGPADIAEVARLAREIWTEHYTPIIGPAQVEYMLDRIQSEEAIARQIADPRVQYFIVEGDRGAVVGYFAVETRGDVLFLSKVYVLRSVRGLGYGSASIAFVERLAAEQGCRRVELTVNKNNVGAIHTYEQLGFQRTGERLTDIGAGFVMDDYVYELAVRAPSS